MAKHRFHLNTSHLVNPCDTTPKQSADQAFQGQLCRSIAQLAPMERDLIRRMVENLQLLAQSAPKREVPVPAPAQTEPVPLISIGPSGLHGHFQSEY